MTLLSPERIAKLWSERGMQNEITCTAEERAAINAVWEKMPGNWSWMSVFRELMRGETLESIEQKHAEKREHICDSTINPCTCGRRWDFKRKYADGSTYFFSKLTVDHYHALYGTSDLPEFVLVEAK